MPFLISLMYFIIMILIIFAAYLTTRWFAIKTNKMARGKYIKLIDRIVLGRDKSVMIIKIGQKFYLMADNSQGLSLISPLVESDLIPLEPEETGVPFQELLNKYLGIQITDKSPSFEGARNNLKDLKNKMSQSFDKMVKKHRGNENTNDEK